MSKAIDAEADWHESALNARKEADLGVQKRIERMRAEAAELRAAAGEEN
jgi:hypothetical protein